MKCYNTYESTFFCTHIKMQGETKMDIDKRIEDLEKSPIYAMSLGSKELFHSNFWAWLMKTDSKFISIFFEGITEYKAIKREEKNRDITIHTNDGIYIIENKIKSLPYVEQLAKYQIAAGKNFKGGVIAALKEPNFDCDAEYNVTVNKNKHNVKVVKNKNKNKYSFVIDGTRSDKVWRFLSYTDIVSDIENIVSDIEKNNRNFDDSKTYIIGEYVRVTRGINDIITQKIDESKDVFSLECPELHDLKDIYKKYKMSHFNEYLRGYLKKNLENYSGLQIVQDYSHDANLSIFYEGEQEPGIRKRVGIQIEGKQYRRYAEFLGGNKRIEFEKYKEQNWFVNIENGYLNYGQGIERKTGMRRDRCQYNGGIFVYQYWKLDDETTKYETTKYETLARVIKDDMKIAKDLIERDI